MYLFYIDESGNTGHQLIAPDQPVHWLVALCVSPATVAAIELEMLAIAQRYFPTEARQAEFEFHGSAIFGAKDQFRALKPAERVAMYNELMQLIPKHQCWVFVVGINKLKHRERAVNRGYDPYHPHQVAFMYLVERIDKWLEKQSQYGLLVADVQKEVEQATIENFVLWRATGTPYGYRTRTIIRLIDTIHYVPSHNSWLIQLVDCVAFVTNRMYKITVNQKAQPQQPMSQSDQAILQLWEHCKRRVIEGFMWP